MNGEQWINFLRLYGPIPTKDSLFDENLRRYAERRGVQTILFEHPFESKVLSHYDLEGGFRRSVILTGTAGDGKTFLCRRVWERVQGSPEEWMGNAPCLVISLQVGDRALTHIIRESAPCPLKLS